VSYDVWFHVDVDGHRVQVAEVGNYTSNCSPMWAKALRDANPDLPKGPEGEPLWPSELNGRKASEIGQWLAKACAHMASSKAEYMVMNPENGWGDYEGALAYLRKWRDAAESFPSSTCGVCA
jgi:hypothetical protein